MPFLARFDFFSTLSSKNMKLALRNWLKFHTVVYPRGGYHHSEGIVIWDLGSGAVGHNVPFLARFVRFSGVTPKYITFNSPSLENPIFAHSIAEWIVHRSVGQFFDLCLCFYFRGA